jgi:hypothetical protein
MPIAHPHPSPPSTGANSVDLATPGRVTDFVKAHGGHTVITKVSRRNICSDCKPRSTPRPPLFKDPR